MPAFAIPRLRGRIPVALAAAATCLWLLPAPPPLLAQTLVVSADRGGRLADRNRQVRSLVNSGRRVELRGTCYSACTMYLGVPDVCVAPAAEFGFHGPSWYGKPLPTGEFERWSRLMADNYREPLRSWFLSVARYETASYYRLSGAELIRMGYRSC